MEVKERTIKITGPSWTARVSTRRITGEAGSLKLTNKRLRVKPGASGKAILLEDIKDVEIETRFADVPRIKIRVNRKTEYIEFRRSTTGHVFTALIGEIGIAQAEVAAYTAYWASLITMAKFLYGQPEYEVEEEVHEDRKGWCGICKKYVTMQWSDTPIWELSCPECGGKPLTTLSPNDRI